MATTTTNRKQTEITSATVNRVIDKATGKVLGYLVKSDSEQGVWYQVSWNREEHRYECTCPATKPCKHERAVSEVVKARKEIEAEKQVAEVVVEPQPTEEEVQQQLQSLIENDKVLRAEMAVKEAAKKQPAKSTAPLQGSKPLTFGVQSAPAPRTLASIPMR